MNIQAQNKMIAEFMGWSKSPYPNLPNKLYKDGVGIRINHLEYHSSWDWQIHVWSILIDKVRTLALNTGVDAGQYYKSTEEYMSAVGDNSTADGFTVIIELLTWYNANKNTML